MNVAWFSVAALGLLVSDSLDAPHPLRFRGTLLTTLGGFAFCGALVAGL